MNVSFDVYPRRVIALPDGVQVLIAVRRNVDAKFNFFNSWDLRWELAQLRRLLRRDRRWRVELYRDVSSDPQATPRQDPAHTWVLEDRRSAAAFAETISSHLHRVGDTDPLPNP
jgi:hypothetical protein